MLLIAENLTITRPDVLRAVQKRDSRPLAAVAETAREAGAEFLDVNLGTGRWGRGESVDFVLGVLREHWDGAILADSTDPEVMEQVAASWPGRVVLNGYSGDEGRRGVLEVARRHHLEVVVFLMRRGIPKTADERLALAAELLADCGEVGIGPDRLWFDPLVAPLGWVEGQEYNAELLEVLRRLPDLIGQPVRSLIGLSNLTSGATGSRRVPWMQEIFLALAAGAGLTHVMADAESSGIRRVVKALSVFSGQRLYAPEEYL